MRRAVWLRGRGIGWPRPLGRAKSGSPTHATP
jgi:hypothetical protein